MAEMGDGYGSECHLLRYLGRHRTTLNQAVAKATGANAVSWLDFPFDPSKTRRDGEWKGLDFLDPEHPAASRWHDVWPSTRMTLNWDAIGQAGIGDETAWLLVEAKAHVGELRSSCQAKEHGGRPLIRETMERVKAAQGVDAERDWMSGYYQICNRIVALHHLLEYGAPARLALIYFTGDRFPSGGAECPADAAGWAPALEAMDAAVGLPPDAPIRRHIAKLFLPVGGQAGRAKTRRPLPLR